MSDIEEFKEKIFDDIKHIDENENEYWEARELMRLLEYIVGYISVNIFNQRLWDYTGLFLNINGLVCLRSVLTFAVGSLILNYLLLPLIDKYYNKKYYKYTYIIISIFIIDIIVSNLYRNPYTF